MILSWQSGCPATRAFTRRKSLRSLDQLPRRSMSSNSRATITQKLYDPAIFVPFRTRERLMRHRRRRPAPHRLASYPRPARLHTQTPARMETQKRNLRNRRRSRPKRNSRPERASGKILTPSPSLERRKRRRACSGRQTAFTVEVRFIAVRAVSKLTDLPASSWLHRIWPSNAQRPRPKSPCLPGERRPRLMTLMLTAGKSPSLFLRRACFLFNGVLRIGETPDGALRRQCSIVTVTRLPLHCCGG